jgi:hypothetical protein
MGLRTTAVPVPIERGGKGVRPIFAGRVYDEPQLESMCPVLEGEKPEDGRAIRDPENTAGNNVLFWLITYATPAGTRFGVVTAEGGETTGPR